MELHVNGRTHVVAATEDTPLLLVLRNELGLRAAKYGCGLEQCRVCTVLVDGEPVPSCAAPVGAFAGREIVTLEGLGTPADPHPLQRAFVEESAAQCGYCIPAMILAAKALLDANPSPSDVEIQAALREHLCRCGTHPRILAAVRRAAEEAAR
ncbi:MAG TPA: (2Fe-2S)-binding protein [Solirubrobacteraceae bacterium]|nr:(2Fe-2S)-binding protein [Solirubrobacteraceae bacterium]